MLKKKAWNDVRNNLKRFNEWFLDNQDLMKYPEIYLGDELNSYHYDLNRNDGELNDCFKILFSQTDRYCVSVGNLALPLFYEELHEIHPEWITERIYMPDSFDDYKLLSDAGFWPLSLESKIPPAYFHVLCFSQCRPGVEPYIINILKQSGIPVKWHERKEDDPIIIRGGAATENPALIKDICDINYIGEGEEGLPELLELIEDGLRKGDTKEKILLAAANLRDGIFVPRFYEEKITSDGTYAGIVPIRDDVPKTIKRDRVPDLNTAYMPDKIIMGYSNMYLGYGIEISRGCIGKCSFCHGGFSYLPYRIRDFRLAAKKVEAIKKNTGLSIVSLTAFCQASDPEIRRAYKLIYENVSAAYKYLSLRIDEFVNDPDYARLAAEMEINKRVIFGVEGCSQRLRDAVSKHCTEEQLIEAYAVAGKAGFKTVKYMFIADLPGETDEDIMELLSLAEKLKDTKDQMEAAGITAPQLLLSVGKLNPFYGTPYQWAEVHENINPRYEKVAVQIRAMGFIVNLKPDNHIFENTIIRGDGRLEEMLIDMADNMEATNIMRNTEAVDEIMNKYLEQADIPDSAYWFRERDEGEVFPWDIVDTGVSRSYLRKRYLESMKEHPAQAAKCSEACDNCGACGTKHQRVSDTYAEKRREDLETDITNIIPFDSEETVSNLILKFETDELHRRVRPDYWNYVVRRALNYAGIDYKQETVCTEAEDNGHAAGHVKYKSLIELKKTDGINELLVSELNRYAWNVEFTDYALF